MPSYDLNTIRAMCENLSVFKELWCGNSLGNRYIPLTPEEIVQYLEQGENFLLLKIGIAPEHFDAWREWRGLNGDALCAAKTKRGTFCKCRTGSHRDFDDWLAAHRDEYCAIHGGDPQ
ncbi:hypothetical protein [Marinovum algicola]|uniref:hypothetical protein n=1 Tax=Marinovum algicola TaxID=42444 RepID=UPI00352AE222